MKTEMETLRRFEPQPNVAYTLETTARLVRLPRRTILVCCKHGLIFPARDPARAGYYFDHRAIRDLRRIAFLQSVHGINLTGTRMILELLDEVQQLRAELERLRQVRNPDRRREGESFAGAV
jgi:DNA-binding transcriptional MerR regulator